jgi:hypothetical protein
MLDWLESLSGVKQASLFLPADKTSFFGIAT